jgi:hypothetical protein
MLPRGIPSILFGEVIVSLWRNKGILTALLEILRCGIEFSVTSAGNVNIP